MTGWGYSLGSFLRGMLSLALGLVLLGASAQAKVTGPCVECHTMHNSQGGSSMVMLYDQGSNDKVASSNPVEALLTSDCLGCHTGVNTGSNKTPYVFSTTLPVYGDTGTEETSITLAGGNFYWAATDSTRGHNVAEVGSASGITPPGFSGATIAADGTAPGSEWASNRVGCAGTYGCHGTHGASSMATAVKGGHHMGVAGAITDPSDTPAEGYRMLVGVAGYEDSDWEFRPTTSAHNQYHGDTNKDDSTIGSLCGRCHGNFHAGTGTASPWVRHPIDYDMNSTAVGSEYRSYGGAGVNAYVLAAPVASTSVASVKSSVSLAAAGNAIVTCISCHRAHGSPYYKLLRWNYAGSISTGCAYCHTSKD